MKIISKAVTAPSQDLDWIETTRRSICDPNDDWLKNAKQSPTLLARHSGLENSGVFWCATGAPAHRAKLLPSDRGCSWRTVRLVIVKGQYIG
jgi:hypothetical protein